jgi:aminopeptidase
MIDSRVARLAELIVDYSLELEAGNLLRIDGAQPSAPLAVSLFRTALARGVNPYLNLHVEEATELLLAEGTDEQIGYLAPFRKQEVEEVDAAITLWSEANTRALSRVDSTRHGHYLASRRQIVNRFYDRVFAGEAKWCGTLFPTNAHAQDAEMSLREYEDFVFGACHVADGDDPVAHWQDVASRLAALRTRLEGIRELRIVGLDTDLKLTVEGRTWNAADGKLNMPDGELFTSPVEDGTQGEIRFTFPATFNGRQVEDVRLKFEGGRVVASEAARGGDYLQALLDMDDGARVAGEVAFGLNDEIDRFTNNILFDEKIGGTMHVALGAAFKDLGGTNESGLHWDMICDLRAEGEVYADGELIWKAGRFLGEPQS